jgi:hypothetical protein
MKRILYVASFGLVSMLIACNKTNNTTTPSATTPTTTISVKVGSVFTYNHADYDSLYGTTLVSTVQFTLTMLRDSTISGEKWFVVERKQGTNIQYGLMRFASDGVYSAGSAGMKMMMKLNAAVNDTWTDPSNQTCVVKSVNQSLTVPKGSFTNAYYIESSDANSLENKIWYNNTEYMLRNEEYDESPVTPGTMILDYRDELVSIVL